jgi:small conductance mechanosensitive channel
MQQIIDNLLIITDNSLIKILLILLTALIAQNILKASIKNALKISLKSDVFPSQKSDREKRIKTLNGIIAATASFTVWFIAILTIMSILHIPIAPLLTSAGLIGAALAFGTQSIIRDFISGLFIIVENQYRVDDYIQLDKVSGRVEAITIRTTVLRSPDGYVHHIPNGQIGITTNQSMGPIKAHEQLDLDSSMSIKDFGIKLTKIAQHIEKDPDMNKLVKEGPTLAGVVKVTSKVSTVSISFATTAAKREAATSTIWQLIKQADIPLA